MMTTQVVSPSEWRTARLALLEKEKELTRANDAIAAERRALPIVEVKKPYTFTSLSTSGDDVTLSLSDLFTSRRQLIIYHFMFDPAWNAGCSACSLTGDALVGLEHINARDTTIVCVSRAPIEKITAYQKRMGWKFPWYSSYESDFNYDFHVTQDKDVIPVEYNYKDADELEKRGIAFHGTGEQPGASFFIRGDGKGIGEEGKVYHTYSGYARALERTNTLAGWMDMTLLGRQDKGPNPMPANKRRDEYTEEDLKGTA